MWAVTRSPSRGQGRLFQRGCGNNHVSAAGAELKLRAAEKTAMVQLWYLVLRYGTQQGPPSTCVARAVESGRSGFFASCASEPCKLTL